MSEQPGHERRAIWPGGIPKPIAPYSPAIKAGGWLFVAGQLASDFKTGLAPECKHENPYLGDALRLAVPLRAEEPGRAAQVGRHGHEERRHAHLPVVHIAVPTSEEFEAGSTWPRISITPYLQTRNEYIDEPRPASTGMGIREWGLLVNKTILEVDMISIEKQEGVEKEGFPAPDGVPSPLAGYSPAIRYGDWVFLAGEIPVDWQGDYLLRRAPRRAERPRARGQDQPVLLVRLGDRDADRLHALEAREDLRGGRHLARARRQGHRLHRPPERLLRHGPGVAALVPEQPAGPRRDPVHGSRRQGQPRRDRAQVPAQRLGADDRDRSRRPRLRSRSVTSRRRSRPGLPLLLDADGVRLERASSRPRRSGIPSSRGTASRRSSRCTTCSTTSRRSPRLPAQRSTSSAAGSASTTTSPGSPRRCRTPGRRGSPATSRPRRRSAWVGRSWYPGAHFVLDLISYIPPS